METTFSGEPNSGPRTLTFSPEQPCPSAGEVTIAGGTTYMLSQLREAVNPSLRIAEKDFEFTDADVARIKAAIETWDVYSAAADSPLARTIA